jgi:regulator of cell morphogenesis and NO signaling
MGTNENPSTTDAQWTSAPLHDLVRYIVARYHDDLRRELPQVIEMAYRAEAEQMANPAFPRGLGPHLERILVAVHDHLLKEERILFPMILEGSGRRARGPIRVMQEEHEGHAANMMHIRTLTNNLTPPPDAGATWQALYLRLRRLEAELFDHINLENTILFPRALDE